MADATITVSRNESIDIEDTDTKVGIVVQASVVVPGLELTAEEVKEITPKALGELLIRKCMSLVGPSTAGRIGWAIFDGFSAGGDFKVQCGKVTVNYKPGDGTKANLVVNDFKRIAQVFAPKRS